MTTDLRAKLLVAVLSAAVASALIPVSARSGFVAEPGVAVLMVDTDRRAGTIDRNVYGQFLEHINHSVVDGLFAEQVRGAGFEAEDFATYWTSFGTAGLHAAGSLMLYETLGPELTMTAPALLMRNTTMVRAAPSDAASLAAPDTIQPVARSVRWSPDLAIELEPHSVAVVAITAR